MLNTWKKIQLQDVAEIVGGGTPSTKEPSYWNGAVAWLTPKDLSGCSERYISRGARNMSNKGLDNSSATLLPPGTVLLTSRASIGYVAIAKNFISTNQGFKSLVLKKGQYPLFYYYLLKANVEYIQNMGSGSTFKEVSGKVVKELSFLVPEYDEQKRIADILGAFDDKIELLQKQNKTLEDMAKAIFKSWFVDFDVVKAKQRGDSKADIMREYHLTEELYDLFPSSFEDSSLGPIPTGWEVKAAKELADIVIGRTPPRKETQWFSLNQKDYTWISIKDLGQAGIFINSSSEYLTSEAVQKFRIPIIPANTAVLSFKLTVGRVAITGKEMTSNEAIAQFQNALLPLPYLYFILKFMNYELLGSTSSIATAINSTTIKNMPLMVPSQEVLTFFDDRVKILFNKIQENLKQIQTLTELRDSLLPRLISGKIRV